MTVKQQRKLLADYGTIKQLSPNNLAINISDVDYPKLKDTLDYLVEYEYIQAVDIDTFGHMYFKKPAFESFTEHILSQETEGDVVEVSNYDNKKVFIVHGHDHQLLNDVELMVRRIGLDPIILKDQASSGMTVIEKIEHYTNVGFGIVLYTACDEGKKKGTTELHNRARQNVVFEHGYLCAKLGRNRVVALNDADIEVPSDLAGVVYVSRNDTEWKSLIMREMKAVGLEFDSTQA